MISVRTIHPPYSAIDATRNHAIRTGPGAVMVWSQTTETGVLAQVNAVSEMARAAVLVAAGAGWPDDIPEQVVRPRRLIEALAAVAPAA
jgi:uncharacterized protein with ACT and thioredoxin-like domain